MTMKNSYLGYHSICTSEYISNTKFLLMNLHSDEICLSDNGKGWYLL